jgi:plasmid maintenance system antidote protein VapI
VLQKNGIETRIIPSEKADDSAYVGSEIDKLKGGKQAQEQAGIRFMPEREERENWTRSIDAAKETADKELERLRGGRLNLSEAKFEHNPSDDPEMGDTWSFIPPKDKYFDNPSMHDVYESGGKYYVGEGYGGSFKTLQDAQEDAIQRAMGESWKGRQSTFGSDADAQKAVGEIFNAFPKQIGNVTSDGWFSTKWGSWYLEGRIPTGEDDYETFKLSIRDHDSGTRFQKPDKSFFVSKDWSPDETAKALKKAADWIANEAKFEAPKTEESPASESTLTTEGALSGVPKPFEGAQMRFMALSNEAQAELSPEEREQYNKLNPKKVSVVQMSKPDTKHDSLRVGTALLGTKANPVETPQTSNISGAIVPDKLLAAQLEKMDYPHLPDSILNETNPKVKRDKMVEFMKQNLKALYDAFPEEYRARATQWYDGARRLADELSAQHADITPEQAAGILAVFSPQKDWFMNVAQGYQCADVYKNEQNTVITPKLAKKEIEQIINAAQAPQKQKLKAPKNKKETDRQKTIRRNKNKAMDQKAKDDRRAVLEQLYDKKLSDLSDGTKEGDILEAWGIRILAQIKFGRRYKNIAPEGDLLGNARNKKGDKELTNTWGSTGEIRKAVSIMKDGSLKNISDKLGDEHKVRNFYNNIIAPNTPFGDATIDTHAVAAAHLMPYGSSADAVSDNFGGAGKSKPLGISGSYHIYMDAYQQLAKELGILPRQLQSITWEAIRELYPSEVRSPKSVKEAVQIWKQNNENDARQYILRNGVSAPVWARTTNN